MIGYPKIDGLFKRYTEGPERNKLIHGNWTRVEYEYLKDCEWIFTEKVDGTNIRVYWDGYKPTFSGHQNSVANHGGFTEEGAILPIRGRFSPRDVVEGISISLGIPVVPVVLRGTLQDGIDLVTKGLASRVAEENPDYRSEGLVGVTPLGLLNHKGERIIVKIKSVDFNDSLP
jgi:hypothetical protein